MSRIKKIIIVGGGTAGWMAAAALVKQLPPGCSISLIESDDIGTVGVGEATIPAIKKYNQIVGIDEADFLRYTNGTFKLGIEFVDWGEKGENYIHGFSVIGGRPDLRPTYQYWLRMKALGLRVPDLDFCSIAGTATRANRFAHTDPRRSDSPLSDMSYAYHFDAHLYAKYLRGLSEQAGVTRIEGEICDVVLHPETGFIDRVVLKSGQSFGADLFIDCSGFRSLLLGRALNEPYEDWSRWLICDRAVAAPCRPGPTLYNHTRSIACEAGWRWRIPLQHRFGNGYVYSSHHIDDEAAAQSLLGDLEGEALAEPRFLSFTPGMRRRVWVKNCVALGLAAGFIEPLESTSIHMVHMGVRRLLSLFPANGFQEALASAYNRQTEFEFHSIRDFIIAHYKVTRREDTPFWRYVKFMDIPDALQERLELFKVGGLYFKGGDELFLEHSWVQVLLGQGAPVDGYDVYVDHKAPEWISAYLHNIADVNDRACRQMPDHADYVRRYCASTQAP